MRDNELYGIVDPDELNKEWRNSHPYTDPTLNSMPSGSGDIDRLVAQSKYTPEVNMSGEGPGMEKTIPPPQKEQLYRSIASKMTPAPPMEEYPMYNNPQRLYDAQELAGKNELLANLGQAGQTMVRGLTGFDGGDFYEKMREGAQRPVAQENARQASVAEYLKNKYEGDIKKKAYEAQLAALKETVRHNVASEDIDRGRTAATIYKDQAERQQKQKDAVTEVESRRNTVSQNIDALKKMIEESGTWEAFGPHNKLLDSIVGDIATDMAKLKDPQSAARPGEVEQEKKALIESGLFQRNSNAIAILDALQGRLDARVKNAYEVRGLKAPERQASPLDINDPRVIEAKKHGYTDEEIRSFLNAGK